MTEKLSHLSKVTQLASSRAGIWTAQHKRACALDRYPVNFKSTWALCFYSHSAQQRQRGQSHRVFSLSLQTKRNPPPVSVTWGKSSTSTVACFKGSDKLSTADQSGKRSFSPCLPQPPLKASFFRALKTIHPRSTPLSHLSFVPSHPASNGVEPLFWPV